MHLETYLTRTFSHGKFLKCFHNLIIWGKCQTFKKIQVQVQNTVARPLSHARADSHVTPAIEAGVT